MQQCVDDRPDASPPWDRRISDLCRLGAAQRTDDWESLRRELLRQHHSEPRSHLRNKADDNRGAFLDKTAFGDKSCGFTYTLRKHAPHSEITAFGSIGRASPSA